MLERIKKLEKRVVDLYKGKGNSAVEQAVVIVNSESDLDALITNNELVPGTIYKVLNIHSDYNTRVLPVNGYFEAVSSSALSENGIGEFVEPNYSNINIFTRNLVGVVAFNNFAWGNKIWIAENPLGVPAYDYSDEYHLIGGNISTEVRVMDQSDFSYNTLYETNYDEISYSFANKGIYYRNNKKNNVVAHTTLSDYLLIEKIRFNDPARIAGDLKNSKPYGFTNAYFLNANLEDNVLNYAGKIDNLIVDNSYASLFTTSSNLTLLEDITVKASSSFEFAINTETRKTSITNVSVVDSSFFSIDVTEDSNPSDFASKNLAFFEIKSFSIFSSSGHIFASGTNVSLSGYSTFELNSTSTSQGYDNIAISTNSQISMENTGGYIYNLVARFNSSVFGALSQDITNMEIISGDVDLADFITFQTNRLITSLT
jgi:hypothetical protein